jgi:hypothetical protein
VRDLFAAAALRAPRFVQADDLREGVRVGAEPRARFELEFVFARTAVACARVVEIEIAAPNATGWPNRSTASDCSGRRSSRPEGSGAGAVCAGHANAMAASSVGVRRR